jgi:two-component system sensor histidine kinase KdpD
LPGSPLRRTLTGALGALVLIAVLSAVMLPFRSHLSVATPALVLVIPVVLGVTYGGFGAGVVGVVAGFVAYDLLFIPPYGSLRVGVGQDWVALVVYAVVMMLVARMVTFLQEARAAARRREDEARRLFMLSDQLIGDKALGPLLDLIVDTIHQAFGPRWVAVLLPEDGELVVVAHAGEDMTDEERRLVAPAGGRLTPIRLGGTAAAPGTTVVLTTTSGPVGLLAVAGTLDDPHDLPLLHAYANQAALAIERAQLQGQALRTELLEEADRWRGALLGAVSHDLRTPLASVKTAVTTLRATGPDLPPSAREELLELIEEQADSLERLVTNLLDMTRLEAGSLTLQRAVTPVSDLLDEAVASLGAVAPSLRRDLPRDLPPVDVDQVLMVRVLANLLANAARFSPPGQSVEVRARTNEPGGAVVVEVRDHGPGVPADERDQIFQMVNRVAGAGRAGLGLTIATAFVQAHGQTIAVSDAPGGGASFSFTMPRATVPADVA